jgi:putative transposase
MRSVFSALMASIISCFRSPQSLRLENMALRQQLAVSHHTVKRPKLRPWDRLVWVWWSRLWPAWQQALAFVQPRTVIAWQNKRFRDDWRQRSRSGKPGRPTISKEVIDLIQDLWRANPTWGSPRMVGELRKLGLNVAKSTVEKYRPRVCKPPSPTWKAFLNNHVADIVACDCFTVPTATFHVLEFIPVCGRSSRGSSTWRTRSATSVGCGSTMSRVVSSAVAASKTEAASGRWASAIW